MGDSALPTAPDVVIVGAGVIGLSLALELRARGTQVVVIERDTPMSHASTAAAGMLAADDPHNPKQLHPLARLSISRYPAFLQRVEGLSGCAVPFQTDRTLQAWGDSWNTLAEHSIDPRQLAPALIAAATASGVHLLTGVAVPCSRRSSTIGGLNPGAIIYTTGPWPLADLPIAPRKGQMLRVRLPPESPLDAVYRAEHVYVVPRTQGPQAGTALIGATVEDAGFDTSTSPGSLAGLRRMAAAFLPGLGDEHLAPTVESWAGLRPATPDALPILGELQPADSHPANLPRSFVATGHFRNGILLAPATAAIMADLLENRPPSLDLQPFSPARFACVPLAS